ncbi:hypothetical protein JW930_02285 [Candidatus Woesearchaeota archaeon]|nr:hypothetical protein [Candidatus Woesearchaeota archaeon]
MGLFKKYKRIEDQEQEEAIQSDPEHKKEDAPAKPDANLATSRLSAEFTRLKAQFEQFSELRKVINERFTRINEQVGELRGMIMDTNRGIQDMEVKTVKAVDLVEAVQPDKLMVEVRKQDAKIEALKANLESNEAMMKSILDQLKELRHQITVFRGLDEVIKLNEEVKKELFNIKKVQATVERHSDKIEGIFVESQKRFQEFEKISDRIKETEKQLKTVSQQSDQNKVKIPSLATKKEVENLITKLNDFEKHVGNVIDLLTRRANELPKEVNERFAKLEQSLNNVFQNKLRKADKTNRILDTIEKRAPKIAAELRLSEVLDKQQQTAEQQVEPKKEKPAAKSPEQVPVKTASSEPALVGKEGGTSQEAATGISSGEPTKEIKPEEAKEKKGIFGKIFSKQNNNKPKDQTKETQDQSEKPEQAE